MLTTLLLAGACITARAQDQFASLGRLFTTPAERATLNYARQHGVAPGVDVSGTPLLGQSQAQSEPHSAPAPTASTTATLNGYVLRDNGNMTTWINQIPSQQMDLSREPAGNHTGAVHVTQNPSRAPLISIRTDSGKKVTLNVGETVDLQTGAVRTILNSPH